jgi:hypothetical protein
VHPLVTVSCHLITASSSDLMFCFTSCAIEFVGCGTLHVFVANKLYSFPLPGGQWTHQ